MSILHGAERPAITVTDLVFRWPDGTPVLGDGGGGFSLSVPPGRSGLVGTNGSGKSTLLALLAGRLHPQHGTVSTTGHVAYLPQDLTLDLAQPVDAFLGVAETRRALAALDRQDSDARQVEHLLDTIGTGWDIEARTVAELARLGLPARHARPPAGRAVRRRGDAARHHAPAPRAPRRHAARRAHEQPRPRGAYAPL